MIYKYNDENVPLNKVGGKAYNLAHLGKIKSINVPKWVCLSTDVFWKLLGEKKDEYEKLISDYSAKNREKIIKLISKSDFDEKTRNKIENVLSNTFSRDVKFAVRSSATDEDSDEYSFAGMLDSSLNVSFKEIFEEIKKCYASGFSERVMKYRVKNNLVKKNIAVAVVIQEMVEPDYAGVMFTINPKTNNPDETQISIVEGLGEKLVYGENDSIDYIVDVLGEIVKGDANKVKRQLILKLAKQAALVEDSYEKKTGKDIEFAIKDDVIYILQCRTITKYAFVDKRKPRTILDNSNIIESYSGVTTSLTYTFARDVYGKIYHQTLKNFFIPDEVVKKVSYDLNNMLCFYENKIYYNLNSWYKLMSLYPNYNTNKRYMENMMGVKTPLKETSVGANKRLVKIYGRFAWKMVRLKKDSKRFLEKFNQVTGPYYGNTFEGKTNKELLKIYNEIEAQILNDFTTPIINDIGAMVFYGILTDGLKKHGVKDAEGAISEMLSQQGGMESAEQTEKLLEIVKRIERDEELKRRFLSETIGLDDDAPVMNDIRDYLVRFGARTMDELKLETITMQEEPGILFKMIRNYLKTENNNAKKTGLKRKKHVELFNNCNAVTRRYLKILLKIVKYLVRNRESLRLRRTYIYAIVRNIYLRIGHNFEESGLIENYRDIFWLEKDEITAIINGKTMKNMKAIILSRKTQYEQNEDKTVYERMYFYGEVSSGNALPIYNEQEIADEDGLLKGVAGGGEPIEGIVKYVEEPKDTDINGYILMAKRTDPGWTVLFPMVKAVIIERGSILSHSAVIAREMGLTLVVGVRGLTDKIRDGDKVRVDGINGTIKKIE